MTEVRPDDPHLADSAASWRGAYVHIPFCARVCPYCDFAVVGRRNEMVDRYVGALLAEIDMEPEWGPLDAVHLGGGTPSQLSPDALARILGELRTRFGFSEEAEIGLEANPEDWTPSYAAAAHDAGLNRVSLGVQSFDPDVLSYLGRLHSAEQATDSVEAALDAGYETVNVDLVFGSPTESTGSWRDSMRRTLELGTQHLSTYALTVEKGTPLSRSVAGGAASPDPDDQAVKWEMAEEAAQRVGLVRYETSHYAQPGHAAGYNLLTWAQGEYVAFGNGAHGHRDGTRTRNIRRLEAYLESVEAGKRPLAGTERLGRWQREQERVMLGVRRTAGVRAGEAGRQLAESEWGARLFAAGVAKIRDGRLVAANALLGDEIASAVLALNPGDC